jgi:hypothetical protein
MGLKNSDLIGQESRFSYLGSWHANLIYIDRKKSILFVNDKTLFNFIALDVSRAQIKDLCVLFVEHLRCVLADEGFEASIIEKIQAEYIELGFSTSNSKSVLGSMNDLAFRYKYQILAEGGCHGYTVSDIIKRLNRMPMGTIEYALPIEALSAMYETAT